MKIIKENSKIFVGFDGLICGGWSVVVVVDLGGDSVVDCFEEEEGPTLLRAAMPDDDDDQTTVVPICKKNPPWIYACHHGFIEPITHLHLTSNYMLTRVFNFYLLFHTFKFN